jgi:hypothetical protein
MPVINGSDNHNVLLGDQPIVEVRLGDELVWSTYVAFLGNEPIIEIRLGDQLLWAASTFEPAPAPEPEPIVEIELPTLNIKPVPNSTIPALKKEDADFLSKLASGALSIGGIALPALVLPAIGGIQIPCEGGTLPTRADIVNEFNKLAQIPSKIQVYINSLGGEIEQKLEGLDSDVQNFDAQAEIESQIEGEIAQIKEQLQGIIDQVEEIMELIGDILSPYWKKGQVRNWQKEADDAWNELIQEYHMFIPAKMLEMISKVIPIGFNVNVLGISIDVLKIFEEEEQNNIIKQIEDEVDRFHAMIPAEYQQFNAEFGVKCDEWRARCTWQYVKSEIVKFCTKTLHEAFGKLIDKFKEIWDALGLPSLPALLDFDVESFIRGEIESAKQKAEQFKSDAKKDLDDIEQQIQDFDLQAEAYGMVVDQLEGVSLFGMSLLDVIGGSIDETVKMAEKDIDNLIKAARDFSANWEKELMNVWIKKIKSFLDAIGLGKLLDLLTLTLCDVLPMIGIPTSFDVELPV